jgi:putative oxidoreductase
MGRRSCLAGSGGLASRASRGSSAGSTSGPPGSGPGWLLWPSSAVGLALAIGLLTPLASFAVIEAMLVAIAMVHLSKGFWNTQGGIEYPLLILASSLALALTGPGVYSADSWLRIVLPEPITVLAGAVAVVAGVLVALASRGRKPAGSTVRKAA